MNKYSAFYRCTNCFEAAVVWVPKKTEAPNYFGCPNCGLATLNKTEKKYNLVSVYHYDMVSETELVLRR